VQKIQFAFPSNSNSSSSSCWRSSSFTKYTSRFPPIRVLKFQLSAPARDHFAFLSKSISISSCHHTSSCAKYTSRSPSSCCRTNSGLSHSSAVLVLFNHASAPARWRKQFALPLPSSPNGASSLFIAP
jgi:hypothetical protein